VRSSRHRGEPGRPGHARRKIGHPLSCLDNRQPDHRPRVRCWRGDRFQWQAVLDRRNAAQALATGVPADALDHQLPAAGRSLDCFATSVRIAPGARIQMPGHRSNQRNRLANQRPDQGDSENHDASLLRTTSSRHRSNKPNTSVKTLFLPESALTRTSVESALRRSRTTNQRSRHVICLRARPFWCGPSEKARGAE
jgi:hypothetical protein